jgi:N4-gp56 family major capsid protein
MALETNGTKLANLINPEVMADIVSAKADEKVRVLPYAKVDTTLQGQAGDTVSIPKYAFIGEAVDVAEGEDIPVRQMAVSSEQYTIKKAAIGGILTDEAVLSGYGNPVGELTNQMALSIAGKCDTDAYEELVKAPTAYTATGAISYEEIVKAIDLFEEETNTEKAMFVHPKQATQLRLDPNFIDKSKYGNQVMIDGEIGIVGNARIVSSKKVRVEGGAYLNPIVKLEEDTETEDASPALTVFLKRDTNVETDRIARNRTTEVTGDKMYVVALTNETKVIVAKMKEGATV